MKLKLVNKLQLFLVLASMVPLVIAGIIGFLEARTIIEDGAFIGSDTMLIAPVRIGRGAIVAAGSVITRDVGENVMAIERAKQKNIRNGAVKYKNRKNKGQEK